MLLHPIQAGDDVMEVQRQLHQPEEMIHTEKVSSTNPSHIQMTFQTYSWLSRTNRIPQRQTAPNSSVQHVAIDDLVCLDSGGLSTAISSTYHEVQVLRPAAPTDTMRINFEPIKPGCRFWRRNMHHENIICNVITAHRHSAAITSLKYDLLHRTEIRVNEADRTNFPVPHHYSLRFIH